MTARSKSNPSKAALRRQPAPLPGFPKDEPFVHLQDVKAYLDAPKITCLLCGREYHSLGVHLAGQHDMSMDDYKTRFGIPFTYGLAGKTFREKSSRRIHRLRKEGRIPARPPPETIRKLIRSSKSRRLAPEPVQRDNLQKILRVHRKKAFWQPSDFGEFFRRIKSGRTVLEVESDPDMPSRTAFHAHLKRNASLRRQYQAVWEKLPFAVQVRANKTGEGYRRTLVRLRLSGKTWDEVAAQMKVKPSAVRSMWHTLKRTGRLKDYS